MPVISTPVTSTSTPVTSTVTSTLISPLMVDKRRKFAIVSTNSFAKSKSPEVCYRNISCFEHRHLDSQLKQIFHPSLMSSSPVNSSSFVYQSIPAARFFADKTNVEMDLKPSNKLSYFKPDPHRNGENINVASKPKERNPNYDLSQNRGAAQNKTSSPIDIFDGSLRKVSNGKSIVRYKVYVVDDTPNIITSRSIEKTVIQQTSNINKAGEKIPADEKALSCQQIQHDAWCLTADLARK